MTRGTDGDPIKQAEKRGYSKGYAAGQRRWLGRDGRDNQPRETMSAPPILSAEDIKPLPPIPPGRRLKLAAMTLEFAKAQLDEEEKQVREFLAGRSTYHEILRSALLMLEGALTELFDDDAPDDGALIVEPEGDTIIVQPEGGPQ